MSIEQRTTRAGPRPDEIKTCRCGASMVFLQSINSRKGTISRMPVNVMPTDKAFRAPWAGEVTYIHGQHQPHWVTCPDADSFRRER